VRRIERDHQIECQAGRRRACAIAPARRASENAHTDIVLRREMRAPSIAALAIARSEAAERASIDRRRCASERLLA